MKKSEFKVLVKEAIQEELNEKVDSGTWLKAYELVTKAQKDVASAIHHYKHEVDGNKEIDKGLRSVYDLLSKVQPLFWKYHK